MNFVEAALAKLKAGAGVSSPAQSAPRATLAAPVASPAPSVAAKPRHYERHMRLDREALHAAGLLVDATQDRQLANEFRQIKRPLLAEAYGPDAPADGPRSILVGSAVSGDGKTFAALNLALSLSRERGLSVVLVDADLPKRDLSSLLGLGSATGLADALQDESIDVNSLLFATDIGSLSVLAAGQHREGLTELLASPRMGQLIATLGAGAERSLIVFDSPPLLSSSEARALIDHAGQVLFVVRAGRTPRRAVMSSLELIPAGRNVSVILNDCASQTSEAYY
ncbi:MAG: protein tyrosine kinase [Proteobacteria bacterium]|nr:protein tyrosine kinase [Pseudomonadota bacterium]